jgi:hypothetical protein
LPLGPSSRVKLKTTQPRSTSRISQTPHADGFLLIHVVTDNILWVTDLISPRSSITNRQTLAVGEVLRKHNITAHSSPVATGQHRSVLIAPAAPLHRQLEAVLITTIGHKVEVLVNTVEHIDAAAMAGIGMEYLTSLILGEDADCGFV